MHAAERCDQLASHPLHLPLREELLGLQSAADLLRRVAQHSLGGGIEEQQVAFEIGGDNHRAGRVEDALLQLGDMLELPLGLALPLERPEAGDAGGDQQHLGGQPAGDEPEKPVDVRFGRAHGTRQKQDTTQGKAQGCDKDDGLGTCVSGQNQFSRSRKELAASGPKVHARRIFPCRYRL